MKGYKFPAGEGNPRWAGDAISPSGGRQRARYLYPGTHACSFADCHATRVERHHRDGNTANNAPENIQFLCNKHHKAVDGRMPGIIAASAAKKRGRKLTEEHRKKISEGLKGRSVSEATRRLIGLGQHRYAMRRKAGAL